MNGTGYATVVIGDVVYVGGTFTQAVHARTADRARSQPGRLLPGQDGSLLDTFVANTNGQVWALTTDGTSLFAGGQFTTRQRQAREPAREAQSA